jgi:succinate dehydrogenase/fumarate reductase flavoprotein subunit
MEDMSAYIWAERALTIKYSEHFITDQRGDDICLYKGECSCGYTFGTNSKAGYTNSTKAHVRAARVADRKAAERAAKKAAQEARP